MSATNHAINSPDNSGITSSGWTVVPSRRTKHSKVLSPDAAAFVPSGRSKKLSPKAADFVPSKRQAQPQSTTSKSKFPRATPLVTNDSAVIGHLLRTQKPDFSAVRFVHSAYLKAGKGTIRIAGIHFTRGTTLDDAKSAVESLHQHLGELLSASKKVVDKKRQEAKKRADAKKLRKHYAPKRMATLGDFLKM